MKKEIFTFFAHFDLGNDMFTSGHSTCCTNVSAAKSSAGFRDTISLATLHHPVIFRFIMKTIKYWDVVIINRCTDNCLPILTDISLHYLKTYLLLLYDQSQPEDIPPKTFAQQ